MSTIYAWHIHVDTCAYVYIYGMCIYTHRHTGVAVLMVTILPYFKIGATRICIKEESTVISGSHNQ